MTYVVAAPIEFYLLVFAANRGFPVEYLYEIP